MSELEDMMRKIVKEVMMENQMQESIEIGTPSRGGTLKIYFNAANKEASEKRIKDAVALLKFGRAELEAPTEG